MSTRSQKRKAVHQTVAENVISCLVVFAVLFENVAKGEQDVVVAVSSSSKSRSGEYRDSEKEDEGVLERGDYLGD